MNMTNNEYKAKRRELEEQLAALDQLHMADRQFQDGEVVEIDTGFIKSTKRRGVICGCYIDKEDGSVQYTYRMILKGGGVSKKLKYTYSFFKLARI